VHTAREDGTDIWVVDERGTTAASIRITST
jgi:hypothetical protein